MTEHGNRGRIWHIAGTWIGVVGGFCGAAATVFVWNDSRSLQERDAREMQVKAVHLSYENSGEGVVVDNLSGAPIGDVVVRLEYEAKHYRYVVLRTLETCMRWEITEDNLKAAKLLAVPGNTAFIGDSISVEVSFTDARGNVWDVTQGKGYRDKGYWSTGYNSGSPSRSFVDTSVALGSTSYDEIINCVT